MSTTIPESHRKIGQHLRTVEAELTFLLNLERLRQSLSELPEEEINRRVSATWNSITAELILALVVVQTARLAEEHGG